MESSVFDGVDTALTAVPGIAGLPPGALGAELGGIQQAISGVVSSFDPLAPERSIPALALVVSRIRNARDAVGRLAGVPASARAEAGLLLEDKENDAVLALQAAAGVVVEALAQSETVTASDVLTATVRTYVGQPDLVRIGTVSLATPRGWAVEPIPTPAPRVGPFTIPEPADRADSFRLTVPADAPPTQPYWLRQPRQGNVYSWASGSLKAEPFDPPLVTAVAQVEIGGVAVTLRRPMQFRAVDPVRGELLRDVAVVPAVSLGFDSQLEVVPLGDRGKGRRVTVTVQNNSQKPQEGILRLDLPQGWTATPAQSTFSVSRSGDRTSITQTITPPAGAAEGRYQVRAVAMIDGRSYDQVMQTIAYPHIQTHRIYSPAVLLVSVLDVKVAPARVGYVMGSGDQVPEALRRLGLEVTLLDETALTSGDLGRFDTIVVGVNATAARPDFVASLTRLYAWASNGGTLVVQYQPPDFAQRNLTPFPAQMESLGMTGISRVTDETAPVRILVADHPRFVTPNRIRDQDFSGWVQERNLNAFTSFDPRYTALLECHDPGEGPQNGGELYASMGKGRFVYTAYAWFRELPAGVPGAYRLFANLVSLGAQGR
ncbi:MAG TPA: NEW3 domain-containing protein [Spirochaetia bacterium]|nr:NEW3 domain-containing protein [Spirochaetia bacterium]